MVVDYAAEAAGFGAVYLEGIFSPCERVPRGVAWDDIFERVHRRRGRGAGAATA